MVVLGYPEKPSYSGKKAAKEFLRISSMLLPCAILLKNTMLNSLALNPISTSLNRRAKIAFQVDN
jgi:hypothetical protein